MHTSNLPTYDKTGELEAFSAYNRVGQTIMRASRTLALNIPSLESLLVHRQDIMNEAGHGMIGECNLRVERLNVSAIGGCQIIPQALRRYTEEPDEMIDPFAPEKLVDVDELDRGRWPFMT